MSVKFGEPFNNKKFEILQNYFNTIKALSKKSPSIFHTFKFHILLIKISVNAENLTLKEIAAQAHIFFAGGYETTATTITFCLLELCKNIEIQRKLQRNIQEVLAKHDGLINYDTVKEMNYLDHCISETLRLYPPAPIIRQCTKTYKINGTDAIIEKGTDVIVPIFGLHRDEKYFYNAKEFIPERFEDNNLKINTPYMPFGMGPRYCIAGRFAKLSVKISLASILSNYDVELASMETSKNFKFDPISFVITSLNPIFIKVNRRTN